MASDRQTAGGPSSRAAQVLLSCLLLGLAACGQCGGCGGPMPLAVLQSMTVEGVERDFQGATGKWRSAEVGDAFHLGDGVRTGEGAAAQLGMADGNQLDLPENTLVRFMSEGEGETAVPRLEVEAGAAVLSARERDMRLQTHFGMAVLRRGARVRIERADESLRIAVEVGNARFTTAGGAVDAEAGQVYEIGIGAAVMRPVTGRSLGAQPSAEGDDPTAADAQLDPDADDEDEDGDDDDDELSEAQAEGGLRDGLDHQSLGIAAGGSATIHAPEVPVAIAFLVGDRCSGEAAVRLGARGPFYRGVGSVAVPAGVGSHRYQIRCVNDGALGRKSVARGRVQVLRDAGTRRLPRKPPTTFVEADGRTYQVYYQNQRPEVVVRWPRAPEAKRYTLKVDDAEQVVASAEHRFRSGELSDGTHRITFEAAGRRSRTTTVRIRFDNRASTASLSAPDDRGFAAGDVVQVDGVALPGWQVSVAGGTIEMESGNRFQGQVRTSGDMPDVALRLSHPRLGTHYYLRRSTGSP